MSKLKKNDTVQVMSGKDKGRQGKIERILSSNGAILVPGLNQYKKHRKAQNEQTPGEILTLSRPFPVSNVALVCPKCKQITRVGYSVQNDEKVRVCRKCDAVID